jgi:hypothetical protein
MAAPVALNVTGHAVTVDRPAMPLPNVLRDNSSCVSYGSGQSRKSLPSKPISGFIRGIPVVQDSVQHDRRVGAASIIAPGVGD